MSKNQPFPYVQNDKKTQSCIRSLRLRQGYGAINRDKIEFQFAVPNSGQNQLSCLATRESRFRRGQQISRANRTVNREKAFF